MASKKWTEALCMSSISYKNRPKVLGRKAYNHLIANSTEGRGENQDFKGDFVE
jgi:hypothetical protein